MDAPDDRARVRELLGREPLGEFRVVVRDDAGEPVVIENAPLLHDGTPMPTRYWLVGAEAIRRVGRLEAAGGVRAAEADVGEAALADAHARYAAERDGALPPGHDGPIPSGGVGGTRVGVKCLHAHFAWHLAGGADPVGRWVAERLEAEDRSIALRITDTTIDVRSGAGWTTSIPVGPTTLERDGLCAADPPAPEDLTNALGLLDDEFADLVRRYPVLHGQPEITLSGPFARTLACVEVGDDEVDDRVVIDRAAAEEVFRTVATEAEADRAHNPGLPQDQVRAVVAASCVTVAVMRHFDLDQLTIDTTDTRTAGE